MQRRRSIDSGYYYFTHLYFQILIISAVYRFFPIESLSWHDEQMKLAFHRLDEEDVNCSLFGDPDYVTSHNYDLLLELEQKPREEQYLKQGVLHCNHFNSGQSGGGMGIAAEKKNAVKNWFLMDGQEVLYEIYLIQNKTTEFLPPKRLVKFNLAPTVTNLLNLGCLQYSTSLGIWHVRTPTSDMTVKFKVDSEPHHFYFHPVLNTWSDDDAQQLGQACQMIEFIAYGTEFYQNITDIFIEKARLRWYVDLSLMKLLDLSTYLSKKVHPCLNASAVSFDYRHTPKVSFLIQSGHGIALMLSVIGLLINVLYISLIIANGKDYHMKIKREQAVVEPNYHNASPVKQAESQGMPPAHTMLLSNMTVTNFLLVLTAVLIFSDNDLKDDPLEHLELDPNCHCRDVWYLNEPSDYVISYLKLLDNCYHSSGKKLVNIILHTLWTISQQASFMNFLGYCCLIVYITRRPLQKKHPTAVASVIILLSWTIPVFFSSLRVWMDASSFSLLYRYQDHPENEFYKSNYKDEVRAQLKLVYWLSPLSCMVSNALFLVAPIIYLIISVKIFRISKKRKSMCIGSITHKQLQSLKLLFRTISISILILYLSLMDQTVTEVILMVEIRSYFGAFGAFYLDQTMKLRINQLVAYVYTSRMLSFLDPILSPIVVILRVRCLREKLLFTAEHLWTRALMFGEKCLEATGLAPYFLPPEEIENTHENGGSSSIRCHQYRRRRRNAITPADIEPCSFALSTPKLVPRRIVFPLPNNTNNRRKTSSPPTAANIPSCSNSPIRKSFKKNESEDELSAAENDVIDIGGLPPPIPTSPPPPLTSILSEENGDGGMATTTV